MARTRLQKIASLDDGVLRAAARLRARVLALLHGARMHSDLDQSEIADLLGVRKSAVNQVFLGSGNIRVDTLGEYLAVMGFEADIALVKRGELGAAEDEGRSPRHVVVTMADQARTSQGWTLLFSLPATSPRHIATRGGTAALNRGLGYETVGAAVGRTGERRWG